MTDAGDGATLLEATGVSKRYGGIQAVSDGHLRVGCGEMIGLLGPNGSGKSTLLNVIAGVVAPDEGSVVLGGEPLPLGKYRKIQARGVLLIAQELALAPLDTVWESVVLGAEPSRLGIIDRKMARRVADKAINSIGHELPLDAQVWSLSPVDRRMVTIARGAARQHVRLLILDEPTAGLPPAEAAVVIGAMKRLVNDERSVILVSHHLEDIVTACSRVTLMRDGRTYRELVGDEVSKATIIPLLLGNISDVVEETQIERTKMVVGDEVGSLSDVTGYSLNGVALSIHRGEVVGIAGLLGSGVSEVIELLSGQSQPVSGHVRVGSASVVPSTSHKALRSGVGFISGDRANLVIKTMTVSEHVALPALERLTRGRLVSRKLESDWVTDSLADLSVKGDAGSPMTSLSGGNQQRALLARWARLKVDLLVADQPTVGVDLAGRVQLLAVLRALAADRGVLLAAEPDELATTCDRVLCLRRGVIVSELQGDEVTEMAILHAIS